MLFIKVSALVLLQLITQQSTVLACYICEPNTNCVSEALSPLALNCANTEWFKGTTRIANKIKGILDQEHYTYASECDEMFTLTRPNSSDSGRSLYKSKLKSNDANFSCVFNLFIYDSFNYSGSVTFNTKLNETKNLSDTSSELEVQIDSFRAGLEYSFRMESLPLDGLAVASQESTTKQLAQTYPCKPRVYPWLNCLESAKLTLSTPKCQSSFNLTFKSYVNNLNVYANQNIKPLEFTHQFKLICLCLSKF